MSAKGTQGQVKDQESFEYGATGILPKESFQNPISSPKNKNMGTGAPTNNHIKVVQNFDTSTAEQAAGMGSKIQSKLFRN